MRIRDIALENRPRERLSILGSQALSNSELLAILLQKGTKNENVIDMCNRLLGLHSLEKLEKLSLKELQEIKGIGPAKAMQILSIFELSKRLKVSKSETILKTPESVFSFLQPLLSKLEQEHFLVLHLNTRSKLIHKETISIGTLDSSVIHAREVFKNAIKNSSYAIILAHNHPSGDCSPSQEDIAVTRELSKSGKLLNIPVLDHLIIGSDSFYSFKREGLL